MMKKKHKIGKKAEGLTLGTIIVAVIVVVVLIVIVFIFTRQMANRTDDLNSCQGRGGFCKADCGPTAREIPAEEGVDFRCIPGTKCCIGIPPAGPTSALG